MKKKQTKMPTVWMESMAQCHAMTGIPIHRLKRAKAMGSPGFQHGRIELLAVCRWLTSNCPETLRAIADKMEGER